jgi:hypothetical protein
MLFFVKILLYCRVYCAYKILQVKKIFLKVWNLRPDLNYSFFYCIIHHDFHWHLLGRKTTYDISQWEVEFGVMAKLCTFYTIKDPAIPSFAYCTHQPHLSFNLRMTGKQKDIFIYVFVLYGIRVHVKIGSLWYPSIC